MNSINFIKTIRYLFANDATIRSFLRTNDVTTALQSILYSDSEYVSKEDFYSFPGIALRMDDDVSTLRGSDTNTVELEISIVDSVMAKSNSAMINCMNIRDRIKIMLKDNHSIINDQATALGLALKVRDSEWVSSVTYKDKTQGSERLHKIICSIKFIIGD